MKFDNIFGNPPYQDNKSKGKTQHKTWISFTSKAVDEWCKEGGFIGWVTPQSWASPSNKILDIIKTKEVPFLSMDTGIYFSNVGSTFSHYGIFNNNRVNPTSIINHGSKYDIYFDDKVLYIPNDFCEQSFSIHNKVIFTQRNKLEVKYDYVTCHNVIRHARELNDKKIHNIEKSIPIAKDDKAKIRLQDTLNKLKSKEVDITVSEQQTDRHIYPILHTNGKTWYSSIKQKFSDSKKVMWSRSGYTKPFYDNGILGCTDLGYYILVESENEGIALSKFLNSALMQYIFRTAKWSGFGNEKVFLSLPKIDLSRELTDQEIFKIFDLDEKEIEYISTTFNRKKSKLKSESRSHDRIKEYGEVFTPSNLVKEILLLLPKECWCDPAQTFLDPSCGNGNFLIEILHKRIESGVEPEIALRTLFGVDIMHDNIRDTKNKIMELVRHNSNTDRALLQKIIDQNIVCENCLEFDPTTLLDNHLT